MCPPPAIDEPSPRPSWPNRADSLLVEHDGPVTVLQWGLSEEEAARREGRRGRHVVSSGETLEGARRFAGGAGRRGAALD